MLNQEAMHEQLESNEWEFDVILANKDIDKMKAILDWCYLSTNKTPQQLWLIHKFEETYKELVYPEKYTNELCKEVPMHETILDEAKHIVNGARQQEYGGRIESFSRIAGLWSSYLGTRVSLQDVAHMMILLKVSRAHNGYHHDSLVDVCGYAYLSDLLSQDLQETF
jgi:hypothetical protein